MVLVIDGVRYIEYPPKNETEIETFINKHSNEIFGKDSFYFDIKKKIQTLSGVGTIPDGFAITINPNYWYIVEAELSSHSVYQHMIPQISKFISAWNNENNQKELVETLYQYITFDKVLEAKFRNAVSGADIHKFLTDLIATEPILVVIIDDKKASNVEEGSKTLIIETVVVELKTYSRENSKHTVLVHEIDSPLYQIKEAVVETQVDEQSADAVVGKLRDKMVRITKEQVMTAIQQPEIESYRFRTRYLIINGKKYPIKGLVSIITGIPVTEFNTIQAVPLLEKLGFEIHFLKS